MKQRAFTLVELLLVISIIALLSSIVFAALSKAREKAKRAKICQFAASVHHALGAYAVGIWDFNEGGGNTAYDASGYGNNGTIKNGAEWKCASPGLDYNPCGQGCSLKFDGVNDHVSVENDDSLKSSKITVCAWAKKLGDAPNGSGFVVANMIYDPWPLNSAGFSLAINNSDEVVWQVLDNYDYSIKYTVPNINNWNHYCGTFDGNEIRLYVNSEKVNSMSGASYNPDSTSDLWIGGDKKCGSGWYFNGLIDDVRIYEEPLAAGEVERIYVEGAIKHGLLAETNH